MNKPTKKNKYAFVLILGYSPAFYGGVSKVTGILIENMPELELHPVLLCYKPRIRSFILTVNSFLKYIYKLFFQNNAYKVIHVIVGSSGDALRTLPFIWVAKIRGIPLCIQYHKSSDVILNGLSVFKSLVCKTWKYVNLHCFLSQRLVDNHKNLLSGQMDLIVIPNALDKDWINIQPLAFSQRTKDIVFLGRWSWEKGIDDLTQAMEGLNIDVKCEMYTDAPQGVIFKNCLMHPWASEKEVKEIIKTAKLVVLPSYAEAFPTVLLEAIACGTPFLASNIAGIPDIAEQSKAGILHEPGDIEGIRQGIEKLLTDKDLWESFSKNGKLWIKKLAVENIVGRWRETYQSLT